MPIEHDSVEAFRLRHAAPIQPARGQWSVIVDYDDVFPEPALAGVDACFLEE
jgi:hypothetical protein